MTSSEINEKIQNAALGVKKTVGLFIDDVEQSPEEWMIFLGQELKALGYCVVGLLGPRASSRDLGKIDAVFSIDIEQLQYLNSIDAIITIANSSRIKFPKNTRVLGIMHSLNVDREPNVFPWYLRSQIMYDGLAVSAPVSSQPHFLKKLWERFFPVDALLRPPSDFYVIENGYPRLDMLCRSVATYRGPVDAILYAPTHSVWMPDKGGRHRIVKYGIPLIDKLLKSFPDKIVIFRPVPAEKNNYIVQEIAKYFSNNHRFVIDVSTNHIETLMRSFVLITDFSKIGYTFSFGTERTMINYHPWLKINDIHRVNCGVVCSHLNDVISCVKELSNNKYLFREQIIEESLSCIVSPNGGIKKLAMSMERFIQMKPHPSWITIQRDNGGWAECDYIMETLLDDNHITRRMFIPIQAWQCHKNSPLLTAFMLHMGKIYTPKDMRPGIFSQINTIFSCIDDDYKSFEEIPNDIIISLYKMAIEREKKSKHTHNSKIIHKLISSITSGTNFSMFVRR